jgi:hypothetical protein
VFKWSLSLPLKLPAWKSKLEECNWCESGKRGGPFPRQSADRFLLKVLFSSIVGAPASPLLLVP